MKNTHTKSLYNKNGAIYFRVSFFVCFVKKLAYKAIKMDYLNIARKKKGPVYCL